MVHKVQGLTLDSIVVSLDLRKQQSFNYRQVYAALSHVTSLQGLYILGELQSKHIKANPKVREEYERLQNNSIPRLTSSTEIKSNCDNTVLTISLLNIRSLRKHIKDVKAHSLLFYSDVLAFTETQLLSTDSDMEITKCLAPFTIYRQDHNTDKYSSMAVCIRNTLKIEHCEYIPSLNALKFVLTDTKLTWRKNVCACASTRKMVENLNLFCKAKTVFFIVKGYSSKRKNTVYGQSGHK